MKVIDGGRHTLSRFPLSNSFIPLGPLHRLAQLLADFVLTLRSGEDPVGRRGRGSRSSRDSPHSDGEEQPRPSSEEGPPKTP